ncbi:hypothetical protein M9H77_25987 [Catharanthus roseus]|uniref:Uncharacterized protein n=1 Tax=Catharanthus roseus TaxID=4058 RepID=A0ACC0AAI1_CATRO|nr:hypothetical protein M9H77_25987 [Catharanthus roseus]
MANVAGGVSRGRLYGAGSELVHFIAKSSRAQVEDVVLRVSSSFNEHIWRLFEHNQLTYIPFLPMMPLVRAAMSVDTSTSTSTTAAARTYEAPTRDSSTPHSLLFMLSDLPLLYPTPHMVLSLPLEMLHRLYFEDVYVFLLLMDVYIFHV